jgi:hypothetical protein
MDLHLIVEERQRCRCPPAARPGGLPALKLQFSISTFFIAMKAGSRQQNVKLFLREP